MHFCSLKSSWYAEENGRPFVYDFNQVVNYIEDHAKLLEFGGEQNVYKKITYYYFYEIISLE